ncbi:multidrug resistance efflux pump [Pseudomonas sp. JAI111]|nr:multidrug resistance efflux pump [Pseudomonas sp. JAI111]
MISLQDKAAIGSGASAETPVVGGRQNKRKIIGILLCVGAVVVVAAWGGMAFSSGSTSTDNAYVRGDVTSLAAKVAGYVTAVIQDLAFDVVS